MEKIHTAHDGIDHHRHAIRLNIFAKAATGAMFGAEAIWLAGANKTVMAVKYCSKNCCFIAIFEAGFLD